MVTITAFRANNEFRTTQDLTFLLSCIGEKVDIEVDITYEDLTYATADNNIRLQPDPSEVNLANTVGIIVSEDGSAFTDFEVGDSVGLWNTVTLLSYTLTEKIDNGIIRVNASFITADMLSGSYIYNKTPFAGVRYAYNLIDSGSSFNSLIDGEYQQGEISTADATILTNQSLSFTGIKSYQIGSIQIKGLGTLGINGAVGDVQQLFTVTHNTVITPFFLIDQYSDLLLGVKPDYFEAQKTLNYRAQISLGRDLTNPNRIQTLTVPTSQSNVGWFNERFNGGVNNYSIGSVVLTRVSDATVITALEFSEEITVDIIVNNTVDSPFSNTNTKYQFGFNYLPENEDLYQNNGFDQTRNFLFDSKINTLGNGSANGTNFGTGLQVIKSVTSTFISATQMRVTATIETGVDANAILQQGDFYRYQFWLITENHALAATQSDKVNLLASVSQFHVQLTTVDLIQSAGIKFIQHPYILAADATAGADLKIFPVDDLVADMPFHIDFTTHPASEEIKINRIQSRIILRNNTDADIILEDKSFGTAAFPIVGGQAQNINFSEDRIFKIPAEIRKTITAIRDFASDSGDDLYYNYQYPFMMRWEYWIALGLTSPPSDLFDNSLPNDGLNHFWQRLTTVGLWEIIFENTFTIQQNGVEFTQVFEQYIEDSINFEGNAQWGNHTIDSFDATTLAPILVSGGKGVRGYEDVLIIAEAEKVSGGIPSLGDVGMVIWIETYEDGGEKDIRRISSFYSTSTNSWFKSTDTSNKVVLSTPSSGVFRGECLLDYTKIPTNSTFTIYARIYEFINPFAKQFQNGDGFDFQDLVIYEFQ